MHRRWLWWPALVNHWFTSTTLTLLAQPDFGQLDEPPITGEEMEA